MSSPHPSSHTTCAQTPPPSLRSWPTGPNHGINYQLPQAAVSFSFWNRESMCILVRPMCDQFPDPGVGTEDGEFWTQLRGGGRLTNGEFSNRTRAVTGSNLFNRRRDTPAPDFGGGECPTQQLVFFSPTPGGHHPLAEKGPAGKGGGELASGARHRRLSSDVFRGDGRGLGATQSLLRFYFSWIWSEVKTLIPLSTTCCLSVDRGEEDCL